MKRFWIGLGITAVLLLLCLWAWPMWTVFGYAVLSIVTAGWLYEDGDQGAALLSGVQWPKMVVLLALRLIYED